MNSKRNLWLGLVIGLLAGSGTSHAARAYEGYYQVLAQDPWFDGSQSTIDYHPTPVNGIAVAAWSGIDNGGVDGMKWVQGGWAQFKGGAPTVYWEYTDQNNVYARGWDISPPAGTATYVQRRNGNQVEWLRGGVVYRTERWDRFNLIQFRKAEFTAEMLDSPQDHTPGSVNAKNNFAACKVRQAGGAFAAANFQHQSDTAQYGHIEIYPIPPIAGTSNFRTWDERD